MEKTENLKLNVWEKSDPILVGDFNEDNRKIDAAVGALTAGAVKIAVGSYVGNGKFSSSNPNRLKFDFTPKLVFIIADSDYTMCAGNAFIYAQTKSSSVGSHTSSGALPKIYLTWDEKTVSWYSVNNAEDQLNSSNVTYHYCAIG